MTAPLKLLLWNPAYERHMTDEGEQLQAGLRSCGWTYGDVADAPKAERIFLGDPRDWMLDRNIRPHEAVERLKPLGALRVPKFMVLKDAWNRTDYQRDVAAAIGATALVTYYDHGGIRARCPWTAAYPMIRHRHTVDAGLCAGLVSRKDRTRAILTGHLGADFYPERARLAAEAKGIGIDVRLHPGYRNTERHTPRYLEAVAGYRVHVCTTSVCRVLLRKIVESVAVGAVPVTDLPVCETVPGIDGAIVRVRPGADPGAWKDAIDAAEAGWNHDERLEWASRAWLHHDWRVAAARLDCLLTA